MAALDAAGHFRRGNNNNNNGGKSKKGTVNVAAGSWKDDGGNDGKDDTTKAEDSSASKLTKYMTIGELLKFTRYVSTTIGMSEVDGSIYEDDGRWDGDVLANIGVSRFCQVQGEKSKKAKVINDEWLVQARRGTNPFKVKTKAVKSRETIFCQLRSVVLHELRDTKRSRHGSWKAVCGTRTDPE